jgi:hypothetical protein
MCAQRSEGLDVFDMLDINTCARSLHAHPSPAAPYCCCRFFPLYPAPPGSCLDLTADAALQLQQLPDLLLLPSDLAAFAKTVAAAPATATGGGYQPAASPGGWCGAAEQ